MKSSVPMVAAVMVITASLLTACASTPSPASSSTSQVATTTQPSSVQTPTSSTTPPVRTPTPASTQRTSSAAPVTVANAACQTQHLSLTQGKVGVALGSAYVTYYIQNQGPGSCQMFGYPGFSLLFADGSVIQHPATRDGTLASPVQLKVGQRARFVARSVNGSIPGTGCSTSWKSAQVQVYPPGQTTPIREPSTIAACDLSVGPVSAA